MKIKVNTETFKSMVGKAVKCASNNKLIPLTELMEIKVNDGTLTLTTTDASNYLYIKQKGVTSEDGNFIVSVNVDKFAKLVARTTTENITLEIVEDKLKFIGNGTYNIDLPVDENGQIIKFPRMVNDNDYTEGTINLTTVKNILQVNKSSLSQEVNENGAVYSCYYVGDKVVTTDSFTICYNDINVFEHPVIMSSAAMEALALFTEEKINVVMYDDLKMLFKSDNMILYATNIADVNNFDIEVITSLVNVDFESCCTINKGALLSALDRISLFVSAYDNNTVTLNFTDRGLIISNNDDNSSELLPYKDSKHYKPFICSVDTGLLQNQVKVHAMDDIELWYGIDSSIKLCEGKVTQIIALSEES